MNDSQQPQAPQQPLDPQQQRALEAHRQDVLKVVEIGQKLYGTQPFDDASRNFTDAMGDASQTAMLVLKEFDQPAELIMRLADDPDRLRKFSKLPPARMAVEAARIQSEMKPYGKISTGDAPSWRGPAAYSGRVSDEDWSRNYGEALSERDWDREFNRRQTENRHAGGARIQSSATAWARRVGSRY